MQQVPSFSSASFPEVVFIKHEIDRRRNNNTIISCSCASLSHRFSLPSIFHFLTHKKRVSFLHLFVIRRTLRIPYFVPVGVEQNVTASQGRAKHCIAGNANLAYDERETELNQNLASPFLARVSQMDHIFTSASGMRKSNGDIDLDNAGPASFPFK